MYRRNIICDRYADDITVYYTHCNQRQSFDNEKPNCLNSMSNAKHLKFIHGI